LLTSPALPLAPASLWRHPVTADPVRSDLRDSTMSGGKEKVRPDHDQRIVVRWFDRSV